MEEIQIGGVRIEDIMFKIMCDYEKNHDYPNMVTKGNEILRLWKTRDSKEVVESKEDMVISKEEVLESKEEVVSSKEEVLESKEEMVEMVEMVESVESKEEMINPFIKMKRPTKETVVVSMKTIDPLTKIVVLTSRKILKYYELHMSSTSFNYDDTFYEFTNLCPIGMPHAFEIYNKLKEYQIDLLGLSKNYPSNEEGQKKAEEDFNQALLMRDPPQLKIIEDLDAEVL